MSINIINKSNYSSFLWNHKGIIFPLTLALPIVFQVGSIAIKIFKNPEMVSNKLYSFEAFIGRSFTRQENESEEEFKKRLIKNVLSITAIALGGAALVACPFCVLPISFAIPIALAAIFLSADLIVNHKEWASRLIHAKAQLKSAFIPRPNEAQQAAVFRIMRNIVIASVGAAALVGACVFLHHALAGALAAKAAGTFSWWQFPQYFPAQSSLVVFLEYASVGTAHGILAIKKLQEGKRGEALFHLINCCLGFFFPFYYAFLGHEPMRIHHSLIGLLISLAPSDTLKFYGSLTTLDSLAYVFHPFRGYWTQNPFTGKRQWESWDFQNLVLEHPAEYFGTYATTAAAEIASKDLLC